jgi:lactoylglutathione lyase
MAADLFIITKLVVGNLEKSAIFYQSVCGLSEEKRIDATIFGRKVREIVYGATSPGGAKFVLLAFLDTPEPAPGDVVLVFDTADLKAFIQRAQDAGGSVAQDIETFAEHGIKVAFIRDMEGHLIEVIERF